MPQADYGPVPMSRLKEELSNVRQALRNQRRVTLSRHGVVVAAIEPPAEERHSHLLFAYTTGGAEVTALTVTDIGRGSPSAPIRKAQSGVGVPFVDRGKVLGVVTGKPALPEADVVEDQAAAMADWVRAHQDATAEEFALFAQSHLTGEAAEARGSAGQDETLPARSAGGQRVSAKKSVGKGRPLAEIADSGKPKKGLLSRRIRSQKGLQMSRKATGRKTRVR